jgi:hypothetical protein
MNDLDRFRNVFDGIAPFSGVPPAGFHVDWIGLLTDADLRPYDGRIRSGVGATYVERRLLTIEDGEGWFEAVSQVEAAREAQGRFVMISLGAAYGAQAAGSSLVLQAINPMPCKLVVVEPEPTNLVWIARHFRDNGIDPDQHWLFGAVLGGTNEPILFPVGSQGSGAQNCFSTNDPSTRRYYADSLVSQGATEEALRNLLTNNSTGIRTNLVPGYDMPAEIKMVSAVTLADVLGPFDFVDYVECDIQQSEIVVFPPCMDVVKRKVRRVHMGTHGRDEHAMMRDLFADNGWDVIFDFAPNSEFDTVLGSFRTNDGVLTVRNPDL